MRKPAQPKVAVPAAGTAPKGELETLLHDHMQKSYDREVGDNESLWRSLPLFAVLLGFAGSILNFLVTRAPAPDEGARAYLVYALIALAGLIYANAVRHLGRMIWPKVYRYLPTDESTRVYADNLLAYHERQGLSAADADAAAARDLRRFLVEQLAAAASHNQSINQSKANARVQALAYLFFGLISSFAASATIVIGAKYDAPRSAAEESNGQHFKTTEKAGISELRTATEPALPSVNRGGRKAPISAAEIGQVNEVREVQANEAVSKPPRAP